jgi:hypothetical protein
VCTRPDLVDQFGVWYTRPRIERPGKGAP